MTQRLIEMRLIGEWRGKKAGEVVAVPRGQAAILEARALAVRVVKPHANQKPITDRHTVTKGD
jgi:hypothetical protein